MSIKKISIMVGIILVIIAIIFFIGKKNDDKVEVKNPTIKKESLLMDKVYPSTEAAYDSFVSHQYTVKIDKGMESFIKLCEGVYGDHWNNLRAGVHRELYYFLRDNIVLNLKEDSLEKNDQLIELVLHCTVTGDDIIKVFYDLQSLEIVDSILLFPATTKEMVDHDSEKLSKNN